MLVVAGTSGILGGGRCKPDFPGSCDAMKLRAVCRPVEVRGAAAVSGGELRRSGLRRAAGRGRDVVWSATGRVCEPEHGARVCRVRRRVCACSHRR